ncbi:hypothetical protein RJI07_08055 [Mycoplasmatota bacterium WC30]
MKAKRRLKIFYYSVRIGTILLLITSILGIFIDADDADISRSIFVMIQALVLLLLSFGPSFIEKKFKLEIPDFMESIFLVFIMAALLLGEIAEFFVRIAWWDDMLHTTSGFLIAIVGFSIINSANKDPNKKLTLNPMFISLFVFCFSMTVAIIWEFLEYAIDNLATSSNMLRTVDSITLVPHVGLLAIKDTMHDLFLAAISSIIISTIGYFDTKKNLNIFRKWIIAPSEKDLD